MRNHFLKKFIRYQNVIISIVFIAIFVMMTVGYALYNKILPFNGNVTLGGQGAVEVTDVSLMSSSNVTSSSNPTYSLCNIDFDITFGGTESVFQAVYSVTLTNNSNY